MKADSDLIAWFVVAATPSLRKKMLPLTIASDGGNGHYEVRVIDSEHIEGRLGYTAQDGCTMAIPFEVTRVGE